MRRIMTLVPKYLALICFALAALIPFQYMLATAMTPSSYSMPYPPILFPETMYGGNFAEAWNANHFSLALSCTSATCSSFWASPATRNKFCLHRAGLPALCLSSKNMPQGGNAYGAA